MDLTGRIVSTPLVPVPCCNGKGRKYGVPLDDGPGIGIDTATVHKIERYEDSMPVK